MAFPLYRLPPTVKVGAQGGPVFTTRVLELVEVDPDQDYVVVISRRRSAKDK